MPPVLQEIVPKRCEAQSGAAVVHARCRGDCLKAAARTSCHDACSQPLPPIVAREIAAPAPMALTGQCLMPGQLTRTSIDRRHSHDTGVRFGRSIGAGAGYVRGVAAISATLAIWWWRVHYAHAPKK